MEITIYLIKLHLFVPTHKYNYVNIFFYNVHLTSYNLCYSVENRTMIGKVGNERECFECNVS